MSCGSKKARPTVLVVIGFLLMGALTHLSIPKRENPAITVRTAIVAAQFPGITPERVEDLIAASEDQLARVFQDIRNKMGDSVGELPESTRGLSVNTDFCDVAIATIAVTGEGFSYDETIDAANALRNGLCTVDEITKVSIYGE